MGKIEYYNWLLTERKLDQKDAKKQISTIRALEDYALRKEYGFDCLFEASSQTIDRYIEIFDFNDFLKKKNLQRKGGLKNALLLLKDYVVSVDNVALPTTTYDLESSKAAKADNEQDSMGTLNVKKSSKKTPEETVIMWVTVLLLNGKKFFGSSVFKSASE